MFSRSLKWYLFCLIFSAQVNASYGDEITYFVNCETCYAEQQRLHDELYMGVGLGYDTFRVIQRINFYNNGIFEKHHPANSVDGFLGNIFLGYGRYFGWFYIATEIMASQSNAKLSLNENNYREEVGIHESYLGSLLMGLRLNNSTSLYVRGSFIRTYLITKEFLPVGIFKSTYWGNGYGYGIGAESAIGFKCSIRAEFDNYSYGSIDSKIRTKSKPIDNQFTLAIIYHFF